MSAERTLSAGWELALETPGNTSELSFVPAQVPGTAAGALKAADRWDDGQPLDLDDVDCWFRLRFTEPPADEGERVFLDFGGIASVAEVTLNGQSVLRSESMFASHAVDVSDVLRAGTNELLVRCVALGPLLWARRRPRARWRTRLVDNGLRFYRTTLAGRTPGFSPGPAIVGPWRPVAIRRCRDFVVTATDVRTDVVGTSGVVRVRVTVLPLGPPPKRVTARVGAGTVSLRLGPGRDGAIVAHGEISIPDAALWWPHTHGDPTLHDLAVEIEGESTSEVLRKRIGFRSLRSRGEVEDDGVQLEVNGVPVFVRGAVWMPTDVLRPHSSADVLEPWLVAARDAGMNMLRVSATGVYESDAFHERCDELGILVWQDLMFANLDYPQDAPEFSALVTAEVRAELQRIGHHPSLAVVCGESEVGQQAAMVGLPVAHRRGPLFDTVVPSLVEEADVGAAFVPGAPCGGTLPFRVGTGVSSYFGVGAYRRPLADVRVAGVRFAAECLAFANVPDESMLQRLGAAAAATHHPAWKAGVPRDVGAGWDFDDVRDHYLAELFTVDPTWLRSTDPDRYLELSQLVTGEVMAEVFGHWRRQGAGCGGGLILALNDALPGAGWGVIDASGTPKVAYHYLRRALASTAMWFTDEGLDGIAVHVANDGPEALRATLRVTTYQDAQRPVDTNEQEVAVGAHDGWSGDVEGILGRFVDASWAYRFGPAAQDLVAASLVRGGVTLARCFALPTGRPLRQESLEQLGLRASAVHEGGDGERAAICVRMISTRFAYGVRVHAEGHRASDEAFSLEPGGEYSVVLHPTSAAVRPERVVLTAANLHGRLSVEVRAE